MTDTSLLVQLAAYSRFSSGDSTITLVQVPPVNIWRWTSRLSTSISNTEPLSIWLAYAVSPSLVKITSTAPPSVPNLTESRSLPVYGS